MAEYRNPNLGTREGGQWLVVSILILVCLSVGLRWHSVTGQAAATPPHAREYKSDAEKAPASSGSMNLAERELFIALAFVHSHVAPRWRGSWGWAIVLLTAAINILLLPLRVASMRSAAKMQRIQPQLVAIKARYEGIKLTDPRHNEMNVEIAKLQKDNGINPLGGCLPLLIQMPLLFAVFGMLRKAVALRGAEWLWLHDLASADPRHILPILMILFQTIAQLYTPSPGSDATQQKMTLGVMTVVFGYISWHYAAGVALYAVTSSLLAIATQGVLNLLSLGQGGKARDLGRR